MLRQGVAVFVLRAKMVKRFFFLSRNLGVEIGIYKFLTAVVPGSNFKDGKSRLTLRRDRDSEVRAQTSNWLRFDTPSVLDTSLPTSANCSRRTVALPRPVNNNIGLSVNRAPGPG
jgi:hypothetical protein